MEHIDERTQKYVDLIEITHPDTVHGVGATTDPYFIIFAAFKVSLTLNIALM